MNNLKFNVNKNGLFQNIILEKIIFPDNVNRIMEKALNGANYLNDVEIPNNVISIGKEAFKFSSVRCIKISDNVRIIEDDTFSNCYNLEKVILGENVESIGSGAFSYCGSLKYIYIPKKVKKLYEGIFYNCYNLERIDVDENNILYTSIDGVVFNKDKSILVCFPKGKSNSYTIPNGTKSIYDNAFYNCKDLENITFPESLREIGFNSFSECNNLKEVLLPNNVEDIKMYAFYNCKNLKSVVLGNNIQNIEDSAFENCKNLNKVVFNNDNMVCINEETFKNDYNIMIYCKENSPVSKFAERTGIKITII